MQIMRMSIILPPVPKPQYFKWNRTMPALVVALRKLPVSYDHILKWFQRQSQTLELAIDKYRSKSMKSAELNMISSLTIGPPRTDKELTRPLESGLINRFTKHFSEAINIRHVELLNMLGFSEPAHPTDVVHFITEFSFWLQAFKQLQSVTVAIPFTKDIFIEELQRKHLNALMDRIYKKTGVMGEFRGVSGFGEHLGWIKHWKAFDDENDIQPWGNLDDDVRRPKLVCGYVRIWVWKVADGEFMDWSQNLGWE
ncbi:hypothetical protein BDZ45DRAFT_366364 [Acephala macrosclerotiorum]|nr:hypothetical protein BDZ45DRAFT_366364 [Acephala macrosclerotiorum]